jgi:hypothetical protein
MKKKNDSHDSLSKWKSNVVSALTFYRHPFNGKVYEGRILIQEEKANVVQVFDSCKKKSYRPTDLTKGPPFEGFMHVKVTPVLCCETLIKRNKQ